MLVAPPLNPPLSLHTYLCKSLNIIFISLAHLRHNMALIIMQTLTFSDTGCILHLKALFNNVFT